MNVTICLKTYISFSRCQPPPRVRSFNGLKILVQSREDVSLALDIGDEAQAFHQLQYELVVILFLSLPAFWTFW
uniref:Uncharacterized protein n=1 Tax=Lepeophtheirus salmonis TaxID=72036 RepID=A0A0K2UTE5_LEPSM